MDKSVTISIKGLLATGVVLLAVIAAYVLGQGGGGATAVAADDTGASTDARTLTMRGVGKVTAVPDEVAFDVNVQLTRDDISVALGDSTEILDGVLDTLDGLGIAEDDIETTGLRMQPQYDYVKRHRVFRGYQVVQSVAVLVKQLDDAGSAISAVINSDDGNAVRVNDIRLRISDPESALAEARTKAVEAATAKAAAYADASGVSLGAVHTLVEVTPQDVQSNVARSPYNGLELADSAAVAELAPVSISAGQSDVSVTVQIVWDLG